MKEPKTHDYTIRGWGHDFVFEPIDGGKKAEMTGWGHGLNNGDYLILPGLGGNSTRYKIIEVEYYHDPADMWNAKVEFSPRTLTA